MSLCNFSHWVVWLALEYLLLFRARSLEVFLGGGKLRVVHGLWQGFLCPTCMKNMPTAQALQIHFEEHVAGNSSPDADDQGVSVQSRDWYHVLVRERKPDAVLQCCFLLFSCVWNGLQKIHKLSFMGWVLHNHVMMFVFYVFVVVFVLISNGP